MKEENGQTKSNRNISVTYCKKDKILARFNVS